MEANEANLLALTNCLRQTISPDINQRKAAENYLKSVEGQRGFAILLLTVLKADHQADATIKTAAAIAFKNFIKSNWKVVSLHNFRVISGSIYGFST